MRDTSSFEWYDFSPNMPVVTSNQPPSANMGRESVPNVPTIWNTPRSLLGGYRQDYVCKAEAMQGFNKALACKLVVFEEQPPVDMEKLLDDLDTLKANYVMEYLNQLQHLVNNKWVKPGGDRKAYVIKIRQLLLAFRNYLDDSKARQPFVQRFFSVCKKIVADDLTNANPKEASLKKETVKALKLPLQEHILHEFETCICSVETELRNFKGAPEFLATMDIRLSPQEVKREQDEVAQHRNIEETKQIQKEVKMNKAKQPVKRKEVVNSDPQDDDKLEKKKKKKKVTDSKKLDKPKPAKASNEKEDPKVKFAKKLETVKPIPTNSELAEDTAEEDLQPSPAAMPETPPDSPVPVGSDEGDMKNSDSE